MIYYFIVPKSINNSYSALHNWQWIIRFACNWIWWPLIQKRGRMKLYNWQSTTKLSWEFEVGPIDLRLTALSPLSSQGLQPDHWFWQLTTHSWLRPVDLTGQDRARTRQNRPRTKHPLSQAVKQDSSWTYIHDWLCTWAILSLQFVKASEDAASPHELLSCTGNKLWYFGWNACTKPE